MMTKKTNIETITWGVPQGSILRTPLFLISVNDLHKETKYLEKIMFAGKTNLFYSHKKWKTLLQIVNSELKLANEWFFSQKKLSQNAKIQIMFFFSITWHIWSCPFAAANHDIQEHQNK